jgi:hypothetical protein
MGETKWPSPRVPLSPLTVVTVQYCQVAFSSAGVGYGYNRARPSWGVLRLFLYLLTFDVRCVHISDTECVALFNVDQVMGWGGVSTTTASHFILPGSVGW